MPSLLIRVDADDRIGFGHLTRCLALAGGWPGPVIVAQSDPLSERIEAAGALPASIQAARGSTDDARAAAALARTAGAAWIVIDGYHFGPEYQQVLAAADLRVLCIDDNGEAGHYTCDVVVNQNLHADASMYGRRDARTALLLGPDYVLLREGFLCPRQPADAVAPVARRILVTLGGGDAGAALPAVIEGLAAVDLPALDVTIVTGRLDDGGARLRQHAAGIRGTVTTLERTDAMWELMTAADLAVSAGGSTSWELAYMGVPAVTITMAANQVGAVAALVHRGVVEGLGPARDLAPQAVASAVERLARDAGRRSRMRTAGQALIDGRGVSRIVATMQGPEQAGVVAPLRAAQMRDTH